MQKWSDANIRHKSPVLSFILIFNLLAGSADAQQAVMSVTAPGKSDAQINYDIAVCRSMARQIVGVDQRSDAFARCLRGRGDKLTYSGAQQQSELSAFAPHPAKQSLRYCVSTFVYHDFDGRTHLDKPFEAIFDSQNKIVNLGRYIDLSPIYIHNNNVFKNDNIIKEDQDNLFKQQVEFQDNILKFSETEIHNGKSTLNVEGFFDKNRDRLFVKSLDVEEDLAFCADSPSEALARATSIIAAQCTPEKQNPAFTPAGKELFCGTPGHGNTPSAQEREASELNTAAFTADAKKNAVGWFLLAQQAVNHGSIEAAVALCAVYKTGVTPYLLDKMNVPQYREPPDKAQRSCDAAFALARSRHNH